MPYFQGDNFELFFCKVALYSTNVLREHCVILIYIETMYRTTPGASFTNMV